MARTAAAGRAPGTLGIVLGTELAQVGMDVFSRPLIPSAEVAAAPERVA